jgi:hypothetical protein
MEGTVTLSLNRYLHAHVDLLLRRPRGIDPSSGLPTTSTYRLQAHRRMRSGELHYIDHPAMGILILVTPFQPNPPDSDSQGSDPST